jgi:beta-galactosidase/beta-glucuronidase
LDDAHEGLQAGWNEGRALPQRIVVPFAYQTQLAGINDQSIHEIVWYARDFEVPQEWREHHILLHFGAVDYRCTVWINGQEVGHNQGGHVPFWFDQAELLDGGQVVAQTEEDTASSSAPEVADSWCQSVVARCAASLRHSFAAFA